VKIDILTLFPEMCETVLSESIIGRAREAGCVEVDCHNIRDYSTDKHNHVDDAPYGGGTGMIMQAQPIYDAYMDLTSNGEKEYHLIYMTPQGKTLTQERVKELSKLENIAILCGHYEGVDERVIEELQPEEISIEENGMSYAVPLASGQKTGWFYDQRLNRAAIAPFVSEGSSVLDAFCYAGGFGAFAAQCGAGSVSFMDASAQALSFARRNAEAAGAEVEDLQGDALQLLASLRREGRTFDIVCLDPPAFIKRKKDAKQGLEAYARVNELGMDLVRPGGLLMTCSCSHHLEAEALRSIVTRAAGKRRRFARLLFQGFQGPDHPIHPAMPETAYLKAFLFQFPDC